MAPELDTARAMAGAGLDRLWVPRALGGAEAEPREVLALIEELARGDGAAGFRLAAAVGHGRFAGLLPEGAAREIYGHPYNFAGGSLEAGGRARPVRGGYRVSGRWTRAAAVDGCAWLVGGCVVARAGACELRVMLFPRASATLLDGWRAGGLRGACAEFAVEDAFVPEEHGFPALAPRPTQPGPLYRLPTATAFAMAGAAVPLGIACAAIEALLELEGARAAPALARAESLVRAGRAMLLDAVDEWWRAAAPSAKHAALVRVAAAHAAASATQAVELLHAAARRDSRPLERCLADVRAASQHLAAVAGSLVVAARAPLSAAA
ncbi:MAG TPA: hypothetical protein VFF06_13385 [Polyangia bacterium]|nr:hypothetical protein [Polyangia bacterium]